MEQKGFKIVPALGKEVFIFLAIFLAIFIGIGSIMGGVNMINTLMNSAYKLIMEVCFYIMAIAVLAGALSSLLSEFGVIALIDRFLSKLMMPVYDLPGAASLGVITCYLSDNPAILSMARDKNFLTYFKRYQLPALTNIGTSFGMGLIITTTMMGLNLDGSIVAALVGNVGAIIGSIVSVRLMLIFTKKYYGKNDYSSSYEEIENHKVRYVREGSVGSRIINSLIEGGKNGVEMGMEIIPGVVIICSLVLLLTNGPGPNGYTGAANEGVAFLPWIGKKIGFIIKPLFGFKNPESIAVPITALGSAGAAMGLVPNLVKQNLVGPNEVAVFTAICMCWSGYLSTHIAMMDSLNARQLTGKAILSHTIGGFVAGISANLLYKLISIL